MSTTTTARHAADAAFQAPPIDIKAIARAAVSSVPAICRHWLPNGKEQGHDWIALNPTRDDQEAGSFSVNLHTGGFIDFATGEKGGDAVALIAYVEGSSQLDAARRLADWLGMDGGSTAGYTRPHVKTDVTHVTHVTALNEKDFSGYTTENDGVTHVTGSGVTIPDEALMKRPTKHPRHGEPSATWEYRDQAGRLLCVVCRFDPPGTRKQFAPLTWGGSRWTWKAPPEPRPLYGLNRLAARPDAPVVLTEGEKAADAAGRLLPDYVCIATMNGAQSPKKADWSPVAGRAVLIWPDHDEPGAQYARNAAALAYAAGAVSVAILDLSSLADTLPSGWDAADALADGWTPERIKERARWMDSPNRDADSKGTEESAERTKPAVNRPCYEVHDRRTGYGPSGLYWHGVKDDEEVDQWICSPLHADAMTCSERDTDHGLLLRFQNAAGRWREWSMPMELLRGSGEELRGELLALGVRIDPASHRLLNGYLMSRYPERRVLAATSTGWHAGGAVFVLPNRVIGAGDVRFQSEHAHHDEFVTSGTLDGWQREIAARCVENPMLALAISAALAGPLLARLHRNGGGFHLVGDSSTGKSTALAIAASVWGGAGFVRTWRATANGIEGVASALNDTALILDEISEADPRELGAVIYSIGNGTGKSRASRTGGARAVKRWRVMLLSSGERTLAATMSEGGRRTKAGQEARLLDIPCARRFGIFDTLHDLSSGRALSDALRTAAATHHGHAGPALVEQMVSDSGDIGEALAALQARPEFSAETSLEGRAAGAFALAALAGEMATDYGITGWPAGEALSAAATGYQAWKAHRGKGHTETRQILQAVSDFLAIHGDARFTRVQDLETGMARPRAGWYRDTADNRVWLFTGAGLREATTGFDWRRVLEALDSEGWIAERDDGLKSKVTKVQGRSQRLYAIATRDLE